MTLTERQAEILEGVCQEYIAKCSPISSQLIKRECHLPFSSATIRAEFGRLENQNYLSHPYISSGRVPTDRGYRFFVDKIFEIESKKDLALSQVRIIDELFSELKRAQDFLWFSQQITKTLSLLSSNLVLTYFPFQEVLWKEGWVKVIKEPEFQDIQYLRDFSETISNFEKNIGQLDWETGKVKVYIGKENPFKGEEVSVVISRFSLVKEKEGKEEKEEKEGTIAILGPKRMDFKRNISLINYFINQIENFN